LVPLLAYALLGTSRALSVSTTSTVAALTGAAVGTVAHGDPERALAATSTLALLTGVLLLSAGWLKLGFIADFISVPVLDGFKAGTGLLIAAGQLGKVLGIPQEGDNFFEKVRSALSHLDQISWPTAALAGVTIAGLVAIRRWAPAIPGALVAVGAGIVVGAAGLLDVALTGTVPSGLPSPRAPDLSLIGPLLPAAAGVALMAFVESIASGRAVVRDGEAEPDADRELRALGAANLAGGIFQALPAGGGLSQTAVNDAAGARTPLAGGFTAIVALLTLLFLTDVLADLPQATLGALVMVSALGLVSLGPLRQIGAIRRRGYRLGLVTLVAVLALGVLDGVLVGVLTSMLLLVHWLNHPDMRVFDAGEVLVIRVLGPLYFANVQRARQRVLGLVDSRDEPPRILLVDMSAVPGLDITALMLLPALDRDLAGRGVTLHLAALNERALDALRRSPAYALLDGRIHGDLGEVLGERPSSPVWTTRA
jgi:MFS superfamily sulfate permease-like transporter